MKQYPIAATALRAALECASKGDVRFYLNGVLLDAPKGRVVSTTGHMLFCGQIPKEDFPAIIIPREAIESAMKLLGRKGIGRTNIEVSDDDGRFELVTLQGTVPFTPIDGRFPEYERVIPHATSGKVAQFDPDLLYSAREALRWYSGGFARNGYHLAHNEGGPALYSDSSINAFCVVMPMRADDGGCLDWYTGATPAKKKVAA